MYILTVSLRVYIIIVIWCCKLSLAGNKSVIEQQLTEFTNENNNIPLEQNFNYLTTIIKTIKNNNCKTHAQLILDNLYNYKSWAIKFYDASAKLPVGILGGSTYQFGNFDECLSIDNDEGQQLPASLHAQYCLGEVTIEVNGNYTDRKNYIWENFRKTNERYDETISKVHWGICVPDSCNVQDINNVMKQVLDVMFNNTELNLNPLFVDKRCYRNETVLIDVYDIIYAALILTIIILIAMGTIFHMVHLKKSNDELTGMLPQVLVAFSIIANLKKLCGPAHEDSLNLNCISGIKFMAMGFIVAGHCLVFVVGGPMLHKKFWADAVGKVENSMFLNNPLLVDTFLFLSGFLFARILLRELDKRKTVNFFLLYIFRYIRLTPAYLVMVALYVTWLPKLDAGPLWSRMIDEKKRCQMSWWANIIYINNYVNTDQLCMFQSWYLSVDTQLFILAPAIIYPLWRWRKCGELILACATAVSVLIPFTVTYINHLDPTLMIYTREIEDISTNDYFKNIYIKTHMRATAYCFGIFFGYIVYRIQSVDYKISKITVRIGWILGTLSLIASMFSIVIFYGLRKDFTVIEAAIYAAIHRVLWSLGTGWVILACITNNSGPIKNFLEWQAFLPLSRLTYSAYLVNGLVELHSISTIRTPQHLDTINLMAKVFSHLMMTFCGAVVLSTMFEAPILGLEKIFLRSALKDSENQRKDTPKDTTTTEA